jgi:hypothetical protein
MPENDTPTTPQSTSTPPPAPARPAAAAPKKPAADYDRAHVPMGEEFDKAKWTMPPWQPVVIALVVVGLIVGIIAYFNRAKPAATGGIDEVTAVAVPGDSVMAAINVHFGNSSQYLIKVHSIKATVQTSKGEFNDEAANASDYQRYYQAFPDLKQNAKTPLMQDARIAPGANGIGTIIVSFPITKDVFDSRQSLTVTVEPYDGLPIVLKK